MALFSVISRPAEPSQGAPDLPGANWRYSRVRTPACNTVSAEEGYEEKRKEGTALSHAAHRARGLDHHLPDRQRAFRHYLADSGSAAGGAAAAVEAARKETKADQVTPRGATPERLIPRSLIRTHADHPSTAHPPFFAFPVPRPTTPDRWKRQLLLSPSCATAIDARVIAGPSPGSAVHNLLACAARLRDQCRDAATAAKERLPK
jgi:hypothetical protein